jgi:hypothetical protein
MTLISRSSTSAPTSTLGVRAASVILEADDMLRAVAGVARFDCMFGLPSAFSKWSSSLLLLESSWSRCETRLVFVAALGAAAGVDCRCCSTIIANALKRKVRN